MDFGDSSIGSRSPGDCLSATTSLDTASSLSLAMAIRKMTNGNRNDRWLDIFYEIKEIVQQERNMFESEIKSLKTVIFEQKNTIQTLLCTSIHSNKSNKTRKRYNIPNKSQMIISKSTDHAKYAMNSSISLCSQSKIYSQSKSYKTIGNLKNKLNVLMTKLHIAIHKTIQGLCKQNYILKEKVKTEEKKKEIRQRIDTIENEENKFYEQKSTDSTHNANKNDNANVRYDEKYNVKTHNNMAYNYSGGKIIKEGFMIKEGNLFKSWKKRYFTFDNKGKLCYYSDKGDDNPIGSVDIKLMKKTNRTSFGKHKQFGFQLYTEKRVWKFLCENEKDLSGWLHIINYYRQCY